MYQVVINALQKKIVYLVAVNTNYKLWKCLFRRYKPVMNILKYDKSMQW